MKTLTYILTAMTILLTSFSFAGNRNDNQLSIEIIQLTNPSCDGGNNGSVLVEAKGGVSPYTYNWNTFPNQYDQLAMNLSAGVYFVHVCDAQGNKFYESIEIADPNAERKPTTLSIQNDESLVEIAPSTEQPVGPLCMKLNGEVVASIDYNELEVGIYKLELIDGNNCVSTSFVQVYEYERIDPEELLKWKEENLNLETPKMEMISFHSR